MKKERGDKEPKALSEMRRVLRDNSYSCSYSAAATKNFGTHSFRVGGFTRCFHVGTPIEVLRAIGGWSSVSKRKRRSLHV